MKSKRRKPKEKKPLTELTRNDLNSSYIEQAPDGSFKIADTIWGVPHGKTFPTRKDALDFLENAVEMQRKHLEAVHAESDKRLFADLAAMRGMVDQTREAE